MRRALALLLLLAGGLHADEETARYFLQRAQRALDGDKLEEAAKFIEKSFGEKENYAPALVLSAELARRNGDKATAIRHLENCLAQAKNRAQMSPAEREALKAARLMMESLDKAGAEFRALLGRHVGKVMQLGDRSRRSKPDLARECYRFVRKGEELTCFVDGVRLFATTERPDEPLDGFMALWVQEQVAEVRTVLLEE